MRLISFFFNHSNKKFNVFVINFAVAKIEVIIHNTYDYAAILYK